MPRLGGGGIIKILCYLQRCINKVKLMQMLKSFVRKLEHTFEIVMLCYVMLC